jgi:hypothetical protein
MQNSATGLEPLAFHLKYHTFDTSGLYNERKQAYQNGSASTRVSIES